MAFGLLWCESGMALTDYGGFVPVSLCRDNIIEFVFRLDKYYMLVRRFVNATFRLLLRAEWEYSVCQEYNSMLVQTGGPLW